MTSTRHEAAHGLGLSPMTLIISWLHFSLPTWLVSQFPSCRFPSRHTSWPGSPCQAGPHTTQVLAILEVGCGWVKSSLQTSGSVATWRGQSVVPRIDFSLLFLSPPLPGNKLHGILCSFSSFPDIINGAQEKCILPPMDGYPHCEGKIKVRQKWCLFILIPLNVRWQPLTCPPLSFPPQQNRWASEPSKGVF